MAEKLNSEFNYRYLTEGHTIWAKIKNLKGFLEGRERALVLEKAHELRREAKLAEIEHLQQVGAARHLVLTAQAELVEMDSMEPAARHGFELTRQEIAIIKRLLAELYEKAEPTRVPGYSDEDMFELNAPNEFTVMIGKEIAAEIIANGRPSPAKLGNAMSNPHTFAALQKAGLIPLEANMLEGNVDPNHIELKAVSVLLSDRSRPE